MKTLAVAILFLFTLPVLSQVPPPQIPLTGRIGAGGSNFPLINTGTINMTDADYTMVYPDMTASVLRVTSSVALTAPRKIIAPQAAGFQFSVENATTGGQTITVIGTGTGVTIANGQTALVMSDGVNYVSVGGGGAAPATGYNVPTNYPTVQAAINAAVAAGSGPVTVSPQATDKTSYTNPTGVRVTDYRQNYMVDNRFFRDVSEWGVKADAKILFGGPATQTPPPQITVVAGSPIVTAAPGTFNPATDSGKVAVVFGAGGYGPGWAWTPSVVSGGSGGIDGQRQIHFTGGGCTTEPTGWLVVTGGVPGGNVHPVHVGTGCTSTPTSGTVDTVTGTVTFNSQPLIPTDLVTSILSVSSDGSQATLADNVVSNGWNNNGVTMIYGTDDAAAWNAACNAGAGNGNSAALSYGALTFSGFSMIASPISCHAPGLHIQGVGWGSFYGGMGSKLISADKTPGRPMLDLQQGLGARVERIHFMGNHVSLPIGLQISRVTGAVGNYIGSYNHFNQLWFGPMYDGSPGMTYIHNLPMMTAGIYANGPNGNADFNSFSNIVVALCQRGFDSANGNATDYIWNQLIMNANGVGFTVIGQQTCNSCFGGDNDLDIELGSPSAPGQGGSLVADAFGAEGSSSMMREDPYWAGGSSRFTRSSWQVTTNINYDGKIIDVTNNTFNRTSLGGGPGDAFSWGINGWSGYPATSINIGYTNGCGIYNAFYLYENIFGIAPVNVTRQSGPDCYAQVGPPYIYEADSGSGEGTSTDLHVLLQPHDPGGPILASYRHDYSGPISTFGSGLYAIHVQPPTAIQWQVGGTGGTTAYRYQLTCVTNQGILNGMTGTAPPIEGLPSAISTVTSTSTLSTTNYNKITYMSKKEGCDWYNIYSDEGSGAIMQLQKGGVPATMSQQVNSWIDDGSYTKSTIPPPTVDLTGMVHADNGFTTLDATTGTRIPLDFWNLASYVSPQANANGNALSYLNGKWLGQFPGPPSAGIAAVLPSGVNAIYGYNTIGVETYPAYGNGLNSYNAAITPTANSVVNACHIYMSSIGSGGIHAACAIYDSDGASASPANMPKTLLCSGPLTAIVAGWNTVPLSANCSVSNGRAYWPMLTFDISAGGTFNFDGVGGPYQDCYMTGSVTPPIFPKSLPAASTGCGSGPNVNSFYVDATSTYTWGPSFNNSHLVPSAYLGSGTVGTGTNCLVDTQTWQPCSAGTGGTMVYPGPGIANANATGTAWLPSFNTTTNQIPAGYIPNPLNQNTTGTAGAAAKLTTSGTANQMWAMDSTGTNQIWVNPPTVTVPNYPLTVAGTVNSGGIPYASSATQESYSSTLGLNQVVLGGGSGGPPSTSTALNFASGTLAVGTTGGLSGILQLNGTTSGNVTLTPSATSNTLTLGGSGYTSLIVPTGTNSAVSIGLGANTGLYFSGNNVTFVTGGSQWFKVGPQNIQCTSTCTWSGSTGNMGQTYQSGFDQASSGVVTGLAIFKSANITSGATTASGTGNVIVQSGDSLVTGGAAQSIGNVTVTSGGFTGASGASAAWVPGYTIIGQKYWADTTVLTGTLACFTTPGTSGQMPKVGSCAVTSNVPWIGIIAGTQGQSVSVVKSGHVAGVLSFASVADPAGSFVCWDTTNAGKVVVQTTVCPIGQNVGVIDATGSGGTSHSVDVNPPSRDSAPTTSTSPVYSTPTTATLTAAGGGAVAGFPITMVTPSATTTYRFEFQIKQTNTPTCTGAGTVQVRIGFTDADTGLAVAFGGSGLQAESGSAGAYTANFTFSTNSLTAGFSWYSPSTVFTAQSGVPVTLTVVQPTTDTCTVQPTFIMKPALFAAGY